MDDSSLAKIVDSWIQYNQLSEDDPCREDHWSAVLSSG